jgi:hypothetical protein
VDSGIKLANTETLPAAQLLFGAFFIALILGSVGRAVSKPLWHDEIFTAYLATRLGVTELWGALSRGTDLNPPLYHLAARASGLVVGNEALATRLPSLIGFAVATFALFVFLRRSLGDAFALVGAVAPTVSGLYVYAYEGRPYGLVLGFSAIALAAWQRRGDDASHLAGPLICSGALMAGTMTHYYAVLMVLPLATGELVRTRLRGRFDWVMGMAIASAIAPLPLLWPLIASARQFTEGFWSQPEIVQLWGLYRRLLEPLDLIVLAAGLVASAFWLIERTTEHNSVLRTRAVSQAPRNLPPDEIAVALALIALPIAGFSLAVTVTGAFHERYVLQVVLGLAMLFAWACARALRSRQAIAILVVTIVAAAGVRLAAGVMQFARPAPDPLVRHRALLARAEGADVVVSHVLTFLPLTYYSKTGPHVTYLTKPADVVEQLGVDTGGKALQKLADIVPMDLQDYDRYVTDHRRFYLYGPESWVTRRLLSQQARLRLVGTNDELSLYEVEIR